MIKPGKLSAFAFSSYITFRPTWIFAVAYLTQQNVQYSPNLWDRQCRGIFFSPDASPVSETIAQ